MDMRSSIHGLLETGNRFVNPSQRMQDAPEVHHGLPETGARFQRSFKMICRHFEISRLAGQHSHEQERIRLPGIGLQNLTADSFPFFVVTTLITRSRTFKGLC
jgi:hypothetical protein